MPCCNGPQKLEDIFSEELRNLSEENLQPMCCIGPKLEEIFAEELMALFHGSLHTDHHPGTTVLNIPMSLKYNEFKVLELNNTN